MTTVHVLRDLGEQMGLSGTDLKDFIGENRRQKERKGISNEERQREREVEERKKDRDFEVERMKLERERMDFEWKMKGESRVSNKPFLI